MNRSSLSPDARALADMRVRNAVRAIEDGCTELAVAMRERDSLDAAGGAPARRVVRPSAPDGMIWSDKHYGFIPDPVAGASSLSVQPETDAAADRVAAGRAATARNGARPAPPAPVSPEGTA